MHHKDFTALRRIGHLMEGWSLGGKRQFSGWIYGQEFSMVGKGEGRWQLSANKSEIYQSDRRSIDPDPPMPESEHDGELKERTTDDGHGYFQGRFMGHPVALYNTGRESRDARRIWHLVELPESLYD